MSLMYTEKGVWQRLREDVDAVDIIQSVETKPDGAILMMSPASNRITAPLNAIDIAPAFDTAGASCTVKVFGWTKDGRGVELGERTFEAESWVAFTVGEDAEAVEYYGAKPDWVDVRSYTYVYVYITAISTGKVTIDVLPMAYPNGKQPVDLSVTAEAINIDTGAITGEGAGAKTLADLNTALTALRTAKTIDDIVTAVSAIPTDFEDVTGAGGSAKTLADVVTAISGILKSELVTKKAAAWSAITTDTEFSPPTGTNGIALAPKAAASGGVISGTVWGKPTGESEAYRIAGTFSFICATATLDADGYTAAMQQIDITGLSDIKVIFTGGDLAYVPY